MALDKTGFQSLNRSPERRREEGEKLLQLLSSTDSESMEPKDRNFCESIAERESVLTEGQLAWMRDLVERYT